MKVFLSWMLVSFTAIAFAQVKDSLTVFYYADGAVSARGTVRGGKADGYWKNYYPDGTLKSEGNRKDFKLDGTWKFYQADSKIATSVDYRQGLKDGSEIIYENGTPFSKTEYKNGLRQGKAWQYDPLGNIRMEFTYLNDILSDKAYEFDPNGKIITIYTYKNGMVTNSQRINRSNPQGGNHGLWVWFYPDKYAIERQGMFKNGLKYGYFKYYDAKGNLLRTEKYIDDILQQDAIETAKIDVKREFYPNKQLKSYKSYRMDIPDGMHIEYDSKGEVTSALVYTQGSVSEKGGIIDRSGQKTGGWDSYYPTGEIKAQGEFKAGKKEGEWLYYYGDGKIEQKGKFKDGREIGEWIWYYPNGKILRTEFYRNGKEDGESVEYGEDGNIVAQGEYFTGKREGKWFIIVNDTRMEGEYSDGARNGQWIYTDLPTSAVFYKGNFRDGEPDGEQLYYYPQGKMKARGNYVSGQKNGLWQFYDENGFVSLTVTYRDGIDTQYDGVNAVEQ